MFWTVNGEKIDKQGMGGKYSKVSVDDPSLTIHNVNKYDAGSYKLTATNAVGTTISDAIEISIYNNIIHWIIKKKLVQENKMFNDNNAIPCKAYLTTRAEKKHN